MHLGLFCRRELTDYHLSLLMPHALLMQPNSTTPPPKKSLAIVFELDQFISYFLCFHITIYVDYATLRYMLKKPDAKPRLIRWMLLLQEFDIEIQQWCRKLGSRSFEQD